MAEQRDSTAIIGANWVSNFIRRRTDLKTGRSQPFEASRIQAYIPEHITRWFQHLENVKTRWNIAPEDMYNMDEIGY